jgi:hypothetical protein
VYVQSAPNRRPVVVGVDPTIGPLQSLPHSTACKRLGHQLSTSPKGAILDYPPVGKQLALDIHRLLVARPALTRAKLLLYLDFEAVASAYVAAVALD